MVVSSARLAPLVGVPKFMPCSLAQHPEASPTRGEGSRQAGMDEGDKEALPEESQPSYLCRWSLDTLTTGPRAS